MGDWHHAVAFAPDDERRAFDAIQIARQLGIVRKLPGKPGKDLSSLEHALDGLRGWRIWHQFMRQRCSGIGEERGTRLRWIELEDVCGRGPRYAQTQRIDENQRA